MAYKTAIIIDNACELTTYNQQLIKETLKQFVKSIDKEDKVSIAVTGEKAEYLTEYDDSLNTQLKTIDAIEFKEVNAPGADVLMEVLLSWKESDVACRDILYVSCRGVAVGSDYSEEELLFEVNNKQYPIYTLACGQNENTAFMKSASSLSRISGGVSVSTLDAKSDAEVEKQLSEKLIQAMSEYRRLQETKEQQEEEKENEQADNGNEDKTSEEVNNTVEEQGEYVDIDEYFGEPESESANVIYESSSINETSKTKDFVYPLMALILVAIIFSVGIYLRKERYKKEEERYIKKREEKEKEKRNREPFSDFDDTETVCLSSGSDNDEDTGTRILYQTREGVEITLEDRANPTKYFRACVRDSVVIGRNEKLCDIHISYDDSISSRHCELYRRDGDLYCRDLGSANGTMINQQKVYQEIKVESGDILRIGRLSFFVQIVGDSYE